MSNDSVYKGDFDHRMTTSADLLAALYTCDKDDNITRDDFEPIFYDIHQGRFENQNKVQFETNLRRLKQREYITVSTRYESCSITDDGIETAKEIIKEYAHKGRVDPRDYDFIDTPKLMVNNL